MVHAGILRESSLTRGTFAFVMHRPFLAKTFAPQKKSRRRLPRYPLVPWAKIRLPSLKRHKHKTPWLLGARSGWCVYEPWGLRLNLESRHIPLANMCFAPMAIAPLGRFEEDNSCALFVRSRLGLSNLCTPQGRSSSASPTIISKPGTSLDACCAHQNFATRLSVLGRIIGQ